MPFLNVLANFVNSEKAVAVGLLVIAATVLVFTGRITTAEWMDYTMVLAGIYVAGKTVQGAASVMSKKDNVDVTAALGFAQKLQDQIQANDAAAQAAAEAKRDA